MYANKMDKNNAPASTSKRDFNQESPVTAKKRKLNKEPTTNSKPCPICLTPIGKKPVGRPEKCDHKFCLHCIKKWSKRKGTCPVCRTKYKVLVVYEHYAGRPVKRFPIKVRRSRRADEQVRMLIRRQTQMRNQMLLMRRQMMLSLLQRRLRRLLRHYERAMFLDIGTNYHYDYTWG